MSHVPDRYALSWLSVSLVTGLFLLLTSQAGAASQDALYQALLKAPLPAMPPGFRAAAIKPMEIANSQKGFNAAKSHSVGTMALPGIGDEAFGFVSLAGFVQINLAKNNRYAAITLQSQRDPAKMETAKTLARKIAGRL